MKIGGEKVTAKDNSRSEFGCQVRLFSLISDEVVKDGKDNSLTEASGLKL